MSSDKKEKKGGLAAGFGAFGKGLKGAASAMGDSVKSGVASAAAAAKDVTSNSSSSSSSSAKVDELESEKKQLEQQLEEQREQTAAIKSNVKDLYAKNKALEDELATLKSQSRTAESASLDLLSGGGEPVKDERVVRLEGEVDSLTQQLDNVKEMLQEKEEKEKEAVGEGGAVAQ